MHKANLRLWICCLKLLKRVIMSFIFISETILYWSVTYIMPAGSVHWLPVNNVYFDSCQHHIKMEHLLLRQNIYSSTTYALSQEAVHFFMLIFYIYFFIWDWVLHWNTLVLTVKVTWIIALMISNQVHSRSASFLFKACCMWSIANLLSAAMTFFHLVSLWFLVILN